MTNDEAREIIEEAVRCILDDNEFCGDWIIVLDLDTLDDGSINWIIANQHGKETNHLGMLEKAKILLDESIRSRHRDSE